MWNESGGLRWSPAVMLLGIAIAFGGRPAPASDIDVFVYEIATSAPIPHADVQVFLLTPQELENVDRNGGKIPAARKPDRAGVTRADGTHSFKAVVGTTALLRVKHVGFIKNPTDYRLKLDQDHNIQAPLMDSAKIGDVTRNSEYVSLVMEKLGALPGEGRTKVAAQWDAICHFSPPPPAKQLFAIEISKSSPTAAGEIASIDAYAHTDPKKLHDLYSRWRQSHNNTGALLPPEGTTQGVNKVIVADIFVDFLRNSNQDPTQKASAIERFNSTWILDKPIEMNAVHLVPVRDSRPSPLFPGPRKK